jgi:cytochrome c556
VIARRHRRRECIFGVAYLLSQLLERLGVRDQTRAGSPNLSKIKAASRVINEASIDQGRWFPAGTGPEAGETRALPLIWQKPEDFKAAQKVFSEAAPKLLSAADAGDLDALKSTYGDLGKACKNCHDTFRAPEEH